MPLADRANSTLVLEEVQHQLQASKVTVVAGPARCLRHNSLHTDFVHALLTNGTGRIGHLDGGGLVKDDEVPRQLLDCNLLVLLLVVQEHDVEKRLPRRAHDLQAGHAHLYEIGKAQGQSTKSVGCTAHSLRMQSNGHTTCNALRKKLQ